MIFSNWGIIRQGDTERYKLVHVITLCILFYIAETFADAVNLNGIPDDNFSRGVNKVTPISLCLCQNSQDSVYTKNYSNLFIFT